MGNEQIIKELQSESDSPEPSQEQYIDTFYCAVCGSVNIKVSAIDRQPLKRAPPRKIGVTLC
ncbi:MAG: hypothetical protein HQL46_16245 [Gammaproteobacteria bacterium]|nr:hypothetical protein [Gammaproteobacteria bacterium]